MFEIEHITFTYGERRVLDNITLDVAPGEIVALTGPNGAGKTTLLKVLAGVLVQDEGTIRLDDVDALGRPISYRRGIGYLSERCPLYDDMTVETYLIYRLRLKGERNMRVRRRVSEAVEMCGLVSETLTPIKLLSQGYRKRVGLADALIMHPKVLLLDDLLDGLDISQRKKTAAVLSAASARSAVLVSGHEITDMVTWCTRFVVLKNGRVVMMYRTGDYNQAELIALLERQIIENVHAEEAS